MSRAKLTTGMDLLVRPNRAEASLWRRFRVEDQSHCREALFNRYVSLAQSIAARHYFRRRVKRAERVDYEQFAYEGLLQAIDRYDPFLAVPFGAFARRRIAGSIADGVARMSEIDAQISHCHRVGQERLRSLSVDNPPTDDALSALSDLAIGLALGLMLDGTGLMNAHDRDGVDAHPSPYETLEWREMQANLVREVARLPESEAIIIRQHYDNGLRFAQIAELLGLSRGRISQLHRSALGRLRKRVGGFE